MVINANGHNGTQLPSDSVAQNHATNSVGDGGGASLRYREFFSPPRLLLDLILSGGGRGMLPNDDALRNAASVNRF